MLRFLKQTILIIIEFCFKLAAPLAAVITMAASGGFFNKVVTGFQSLPQAIRDIIWWIRNIPDISVTIDDYNTLTAASFNRKYGSGTVNYVMDYLNEGVSYLQLVYVNLSEQLIITFLAAVVVFMIFYMIARAVRFIRQEGQGSFVTKFERRTGNRVFDRRKTDSE